MKKALSLILALVLCLGLCSCGSNVKPVIEQIDALDSNITLDSGPYIEKAEAAYNALTDAEKEKVTNYAILVSARSQFDELFKNVAAAIALIESLPNQEDIHFGDGFDIQDAWNAYNALTDKEKTKVTNLDKLKTAIETVNKIPASADEVYLNYTMEVCDYYGRYGYTQCAFCLSVTPNWDYIRFENVKFEVQFIAGIASGIQSLQVSVSQNGYASKKTQTFLANKSCTEAQIVGSSFIYSTKVISGTVYFNIGQ